MKPCSRLWTPPRQLQRQQGQGQQRPYEKKNEWWWFDPSHSHILAILMEDKEEEEEVKDPEGQGRHQQHEPTTTQRQSTTTTTHYDTDSSAASSQSQRSYSKDNDNKGTLELMLRFQVYPVQCSSSSTTSLAKKEVISVQAPRSLRWNRRSTNPENDDRNYSSTSTLPPCPYPQLLSVKQSLDKKLLALQTSPTSVLITAVMQQNSRRSRRRTRSSKHCWTIDLASGDPHPIEETATFDGRVKQHQQLSNSMQVLVTDNDSILPNNGIVWSDHGGHSQDLVLVSRKAVLFYKVSLRRHQVALTHSYSHPDASVVWWEPASRALVVGSNYHPHSSGRPKKRTPPTNNERGDSANTRSGGGPEVCLYLQTYFLHWGCFPKRTPKVKMGGIGLVIPRLELPRPDRLPPFPVGGGILHSSSVRTKNTSSGSTMAIVSLYQQPYVVEVNVAERAVIVSSQSAALQSSSSSSSMLIVTLSVHRLERVTRQVLTRTTTDTVEFSTRADQRHPSFNDNITVSSLGVIDNLLCVHFPCLGRQVFCDVASDPILTIATSMSDLDDPPFTTTITSDDTAFLMAPTSLLVNSVNDSVWSVELDLAKLSNHCLDKANRLGFLLRRASTNSSARSLALELLSTVVATGSSEDCERCFQEVATTGTWVTGERTAATVAATTPGTSRVSDAWLDLAYRCTLASGVDFGLISLLRLDLTTTSSKRSSALTREEAKSQQQHQHAGCSTSSPPSVLTQRDVVQHILLPRAWHVLMSISDKQRADHNDFKLLQKCVMYAVALWNNQEPFCCCLALHTLVLALQWHLKRPTHMLYMIRSLRLTKWQAKHLADLVMVILVDNNSCDHQKGNSSSNDKVKDEILDAAQSWLEGTYPCHWVYLLLWRRHLQRAMHACRHMVAGSVHHVHAQRLFRGPDFVRVCLELLLLKPATAITPAVPKPAADDYCLFLLQSLVDFLRHWHPSCLQAEASSYHYHRRDVGYHKRYLDLQEGVFYGRPGAWERMKRRPSMHLLETTTVTTTPSDSRWNSSGGVDGRGNQVDKQQKRMSEVALLFPHAMELLSLPRSYICTVKHLFGYV